MLGCASSRQCAIWPNVYEADEDARRKAGNSPWKRPDRFTAAIFVTREAFSVDTRPCLSPTVHLLTQLAKGRIFRFVSRRVKT